MYELTELLQNEVSKATIVGQRELPLLRLQDKKNKKIK